MDSWIFEPKGAIDALLAPLYLWVLVRVVKHAWMYEPKRKSKQRVPTT
jgi:hypothetical protein